MSFPGSAGELTHLSEGHDTNEGQVFTVSPDNKGETHSFTGDLTPKEFSDVLTALEQRYGVIVDSSYPNQYFARILTKEVKLRELKSFLQRKGLKCEKENKQHHF